MIPHLLLIVCTLPETSWCFSTTLLTVLLSRPTTHGGRGDSGSLILSCELRCCFKFLSSWVAMKLLLFPCSQGSPLLKPLPGTSLRGHCPALPTQIWVESQYPLPASPGAGSWYPQKSFNTERILRFPLVGEGCTMHQVHR